MSAATHYLITLNFALRVSDTPRVESEMRPVFVNKPEPAAPLYKRRGVILIQIDVQTRCVTVHSVLP